MTITTYKWSIAQWHKLVESGVLDHKAVELLEGEIINMSPEGIPHSHTTRSVGKYLQNQLEGLALISEAHPITLDNSEPEPDIAIVRLPESIYAQHHPYSDDIYWLIEVSNTTLQIDMTVKAKIYAQNNIPEYWVIDLVNKKLIVHTQPQNNCYSQVKEFTTGTISAEAFPNIPLAINKLLL
jgi:Uma2 family endonuclease